MRELDRGIQFFLDSSAGMTFCKLFNCRSTKNKRIRFKEGDIKKARKIRVVGKPMKRAVWMLAFLVTTLIISSHAYAQEWVSTYSGDPCNVDRQAKDIQQTSDGGYVVLVGATYQPYITGSVRVLKVNADGSISWQKSYGSYYVEPSAIQVTSDGGYIVVGYTRPYELTRSDVWILKINADGSVAWEKTYGGSEAEVASSIRQTSDGGYIVHGSIKSWTYYPYPEIKSIVIPWVLRLDPNGDVIWQRTYTKNDTVPYEYNSANIEQTLDGGYILAGGAEGYDTVFPDIVFLKLNPDGGIAWEKNYIIGNQSQSVANIQQTSDGGYIAAGSYEQGLWIMKLNADGSMAWLKSYGESGRVDRGFDVKQTLDGGYIMGNHDSLLKLDSGGNIVWQHAYSGSYNGLRTVRQTSDGGYVGIYKVVSNDWCNLDDPGYEGGYENFGILKLNSEGDIPCCWVVAERNVILNSNSSVTINDGNRIVQDTSVTPLSIAAVSPQDVSAVKNFVCPGIVVNKIVLVDLDKNIVTDMFKTGANIRFKVKFTVYGQATERYKAVATGKVVGESGSGWTDIFSTSRKKLVNGCQPQQKVYWDRRMPINAPAYDQAKFTIKFKEYNAATKTWNLLDTYSAPEYSLNKAFLIQP
jgi:hypothetical protein